MKYKVSELADAAVDGFKGAFRLYFAPLAWVVRSLRRLVARLRRGT